MLRGKETKVSNLSRIFENLLIELSGRAKRQVTGRVPRLMKYNYDRIRIERNTWEIPCPPAAVQSPCRSTDLSNFPSPPTRSPLHVQPHFSGIFHNTPFVTPLLQQRPDIAPRSTVDQPILISTDLIVSFNNYPQEGGSFSTRNLDEYRARSIEVQCFPSQGRGEPEATSDRRTTLRADKRRNKRTKVVDSKVEENEEPVSPWKRDTCDEAVL